jgi:hypothetical protein
MTLRSFPLAVCLLALTVNVFAQDDSPIPVPQPRLRAAQALAEVLPP